MNHIEKIGFKKEHLSQINLRDIDIIAAQDLLQLDEQFFENAWTIREKDLIIVCFGVFEYRNVPMAEAWMIGSKHLQDYWRPVREELMKVIENLSETLKLQRIQITINVNHTVCVRSAESLGFIQEGLMQKYCHGGEHAYMYGRIF